MPVGAKAQAVSIAGVAACECVICGTSFEAGQGEGCPGCGGELALEPGSATVSERRPPIYRPGDHAAFVYDSDERFVSVSLRFVREGIVAGHRVVGVLDERGDGLLRSVLTAAEGRRVETVSPAEVYVDGFRADRTCDVLRQMVAASEGVLRIFGGLDAAGAASVDPAEWRRYERTLGDVYTDDALGLCLYDARHCPAELLGSAVGHPLLSTPDRIHVCA